MTKEYIKFIKKSKYRKQLEAMIEDLHANTLQKYDVKKITGKDNMYRIRIGPIRCVYLVKEGRNCIVTIEKRGDVY